MSGHTPGPWHIVDYGDDYEVLVIHRDSESRICFMATPGSHGDPAKIAADGRLIAAAPELLAALRDLIGSFDSDIGIVGKATLARARAAIAKAEGK